MGAALIYQHQTAAASQAVADAMSAQIEAFEHGDGDDASTRNGTLMARGAVSMIALVAFVLVGAGGFEPPASRL